MAHSSSHSRRPCLYWFNPLCDLTAGRGTSFTPSEGLRDLAHDLALVPALLASPDDIVVVPELPSTEFLQSQKAAGLPDPELITWDAGSDPPPELLQRRIAGLHPWGWSPDSVAALEPLAAQLPDGTASPSALWSESRRQLYSKSWSAAWLAEVIDDLHADGGDSWLCGRDEIGITCREESAVARTVAEGFEAGWQRAVIKSDFGAAGGQQMVVNAAELKGYQRQWLRRTLVESGAVVVEPWLDRVVDLSAQYEIDEDGSICFLGTRRFLSDNRGRFQGVFVHEIEAGLDADVRGWLHGGDNDRLPELCARLGGLLQARLPAEYRGPVGIDAFVYCDAAQTLRLKPIVEVNPRYTMGRLALVLGEHVLAERTAQWRIVRVKDVIDAGFTSIAAWAEDLQQRMPLEMTEGGGRISRGVVFTNDPTTARSFVGMLAVGESQVDLEKVTDVPRKV